MLVVLLRLAKRQVLRAPRYGDFWGPDNHQQCQLVSLLQQSPAIQKYRWSQMSSHRVPTPAARFGGLMRDVLLPQSTQKLQSEMLHCAENHPHYHSYSSTLGRAGCQRVS